MSEAQNAKPSPDSVPAGNGLSERWLEAHSELAALAVVALGLALRIRAAYGTFLNPDEALHYFIANRASWGLMYQASLTMAHPPLLICLLYVWRQVGSSEFVLRLPSVLAGTAFCWVFFKWMMRIFGQAAAWVGLIFVTLLPPMVSLSAEVRQYELLLLFAISGAYFLERALAENSAGFMLASFVCLYLAMLSHYSGFLFAAAIGLYSLSRILDRGTAPGLRVAWGAGQMGALGIAVALYASHIAHIRGTTMAEGALDSWLYKSYLHSGQNPLLFVLARSFSVFQYIFGQRVIGALLALFFAAGIVFVLRGNISLPKRGPTLQQSAALLVLPFAVNCGAALVDAYPYGGTRHCVFLVVFATAGIALCLVKLTRERIMRGSVVAILLVLLCWVSPSIFHPSIARADQKQAQMQRATAFIREQISSSEPIFVDYESGLLLGHYLCEQRPTLYDDSLAGFLVFRCGEHQIISTNHDLWAFTPQIFLSQWSDLMRSGQFKAGDTVWVGQAGFSVTLDDDLRREFSDFQDLQTKAFGKNIRLFRIVAGRPMPIPTPCFANQEAKTRFARLFRLHIHYVDDGGFRIQNTVQFDL